MKKIQRIFAMIGVVLLIGLYASTLFFAITDNSATQGFLRLSIAFTIMIPVLLYAFTLFFRLSHPSDQEEQMPPDENEDTLQDKNQEQK